MDNRFDHMMDSVVKFRSQVRDFVINPPPPTPFQEGKHIHN